MYAPLFIDLDGTLADSEPLHWEAWRHTLSSIGVDFSWEEYVATAVGRTDPEILADLMVQWANQFHGLNHNAILRAKRDSFVSLALRTPILDPQIIGMLLAMADRGLALVTSSTRIEAEALLQQDCLFKCFKAVICVEDVTQPKPNPEPYLLAMQRLGVAHGIAFEDSAAGIASARAAGLQVFAVKSPKEFVAVMRNELLKRGHVPICNG